MSAQVEHKKEDSGETVDSGISMSFPLLSSDEEYKPSRNPVDSGFPPTKATFPIARDDPIVAIWDSSLRNKVLMLINTNTDWCALDVVRRGYLQFAEENPVVVLITVRNDASVPEWRRLVREIKKCCIDERCLDVIVQAQEGHVFRGVGAWVSRPYEQRPLIGSSICIAGSSDSGTIGGYLELRKEGEQPITVGVTCHHVIVSGSAVLSRVSPNSTNPISICHPSATDCQENEETARSDIEQHENKIRDIKSKVGVGLASSAEIRSLPKKETALTAEKALFSTTQPFNTHLGYVFASSGFRRKQQEPAKDGCSIDWALVRVHQDRLGDNKFPEGVFRWTNRPTIPYITDTTVMDIGDRAVKWGRTTGHTAGTFNSIKSDVHLPDSDGPSREWCFIGRNWGDFGGLGDSGSFVLSKDGDLGGLLFGGSQRGLGEFVLSYVTPITEVFSDIEKQLGYSVHLPEV
ncbi:MAG: hypothetical protein M1813_005413 [Trichoglossum hirsutum]|nr:MAG: hypothetical protein M1813_005413 [Trichoglossum hirsutum]